MKPDRKKKRSMDLSLQEPAPGRIAGWTSKLEVPFSHLVNTDSFGLFFAKIVSEIESFRSIYNQKRNVYRIHHRIRNQAHPVPELAEEEVGVNSRFGSTRCPNRKERGCGAERLATRSSFRIGQVGPSNGLSLLLAIDALNMETSPRDGNLYSSPSPHDNHVSATIRFRSIHARNRWCQVRPAYRYDPVRLAGLARGPSYVVASATVRLASRSIPRNLSPRYPFGRSGGTIVFMPSSFYMQMKATRRHIEALGSKVCRGNCQNCRGRSYNCSRRYQSEEAS